MKRVYRFVLLDEEVVKRIDVSYDFDEEIVKRVDVSYYLMKTL